MTRRGAVSAISGTVEPDSLRSVTFFNRIVSNPIMQAALQDGSSLFFDLLLKKEFLALFAQGK